MAESVTLKLGFGCLQDPISVQLTKAGWKFEEAFVKGSQSDSECVNRLFVSNILTPSEVAKARKRIMKQLGSHLGKFKENHAKVDNA